MVGGRREFVYQINRLPLTISDTLVTRMPSATYSVWSKNITKNLYENRCTHLFLTTLPLVEALKLRGLEEELCTGFFHSCVLKLHSTDSKTLHNHPAICHKIWKLERTTDLQVLKLYKMYGLSCPFKIMLWLNSNATLNMQCGILITNMLAVKQHVITNQN